MVRSAASLLQTRARSSGKDFGPTTSIACATSHACLPLSRPAYTITTAPTFPHYFRYHRSLVEYAQRQRLTPTVHADMVEIDRRQPSKALGNLMGAGMPGDVTPQDRATGCDC